MKLFFPSPRNMVLAVASVSALISASAFAGDQKVNCRNEVVDQQAIYSGQASCIAYFTNSLGYEQIAVLDAFVAPTTESTVTLRQVTVGNDAMLYDVQCDAPIQFAYYAPVYGEVCDYTPKVSLNVVEDNIYMTTIYANASDRDGSIAKYEWWIDGQKQATSGSSVSLTRRGSESTAPKLIHVKVTDNDGHTDQDATQAGFKSADECGNRRC